MNIIIKDKATQALIDRLGMKLLEELKRRVLEMMERVNADTQSNLIEVVAYRHGRGVCLQAEFNGGQLEQYLNSQHLTFEGPLKRKPKNIVKPRTTSPTPYRALPSKQPANFIDTREIHGDREMANQISEQRLRDIMKAAKKREECLRAKPRDQDGAISSGIELEKLLDLQTATALVRTYRAVQSIEEANLAVETRALSRLISNQKLLIDALGGAHGN